MRIDAMNTSERWGRKQAAMQRDALVLCPSSRSVNWCLAEGYKETEISAVLWALQIRLWKDFTFTFFTLLAQI